MSDPIENMFAKPQSAKNEQQRAEYRRQQRKRLAAEAVLTIDEISQYSPDSGVRPLDALVSIYCALLIAESTTQ